MMRRVTLALACTALVAIPTIDAQARIVRLEVTKTEPAFGGRGFGEIGTFERVTGKAHGEVDPQSPANAIIQDIALAPRNARGMVEYTTDIEIVRPTDRPKGNGVLFVNMVNRGNKHGSARSTPTCRWRPGQFPDNNALTNAGDGWMMRQGYTHGLVRLAAGRDARQQPRHHDGAGGAQCRRHADHRRRAQRADGRARADNDDQPVERLVHRRKCGYPTVDRQPDAARRRLPADADGARTEQEPRSPIPNTEWTFGACDRTAGRRPTTRRSAIRPASSSDASTS